MTRPNADDQLAALALLRAWRDDDWPGIEALLEDTHGRAFIALALCTYVNAALTLLATRQGVAPSDLLAEWQSMAVDQLAGGNHDT
jgi:hypothetical protein